MLSLNLLVYKLSAITPYKGLFTTFETLTKIITTKLDSKIFSQNNTDKLFLKRSLNILDSGSSKICQLKLDKQSVKFLIKQLFYSLSELPQFSKPGTSRNPHPPTTWCSLLGSTYDGSNANWMIYKVPNEKGLQLKGSLEGTVNTLNQSVPAHLSGMRYLLATIRVSLAVDGRDYHYKGLLNYASLLL